MAGESEQKPARERTDGKDASRPEEPDERGWRRTARVWGLRLGVVALLVGLAFAIPWLRYYLSHESTDDAYVDGTIVPISPQVSGQVVQVAVRENQTVAKGDLLFEIDPSDYRARLGQAQATLASRRAAVDAAEAQVNLEQRAGSQSAFDQADAQWKVDGARLEEARASVAQATAALENARAQHSAARLAVKDAESALVLAQIGLDRTRVVAPRAGRVAMKEVHRGRYVSTGEDVMALVDLQDVWVRANYKETQVGRMRVGQPVDIEVDAYPGRHFHGHVESFQAGSGSVFSLLPPENATGNFVKVVQRIPVRIAVDDPPGGAHPLLPGMSVVPHVDIGWHGEPKH
jgi:membrane fusion protein (multidrug efflux system)